MKFEKNASGITRYIAFGIHKEYALVGGQNIRQEWALPPRRVGMEQFREWAAANNHPHWKAELARLEPRLGRNKAIVAIARKLLIAVSLPYISS